MRLAHPEVNKSEERQRKMRIDGMCRIQSEGARTKTKVRTLDSVSDEYAVCVSGIHTQWNPYPIVFTSLPHATSYTLAKPQAASCDSFHSSKTSHFSQTPHAIHPETGETSTAPFIHKRACS